MRAIASILWSRVRARPLLSVAWAACACAGPAMWPVVPATPRALLLLCFILAGPGSVALSWVRHDLPATLVFALVPAIGVATWTLLNTALVEIGVWHPSALVLCASGAALLLIALTAAVRRPVPGPGVSS